MPTRKYPPDPFVIDPPLAGGRLTLESGVPRSVLDQLAKTNIFYTPDVHDQISLFDGVNWLPYHFAELVHGVPDVADTNHDVFVFLKDQNTVELELVAFTNDTTRATGLTRVDGRQTKSGDSTRLYVGTFRTSSVAGEAEDSEANPNVFNFYNRTWKDRYIVEAASGTRAVSDFVSGVVTQAIAEAGTSKAPFAWTAERVKQAVGYYFSDTAIGGWNPSANLIAHWRLDDNLGDTVVIDSSPNSFDGIMIGGNTSAISVSGLISVGKAHDFNGSTHAHNIDAAIATGNLATATKGTLCCVISPDDVAADSLRFFSFGDTSAVEEISFMQGAVNGTIRAWCRIAGTMQWDCETDDVVISNGTKAWVVLVHDGTAPKMFVGDAANGMREVSITFSVSLNKTKWFNDATGIDTGRIGVKEVNGSTGKYFNGTMDGSRVYDINWSLNDCIGWFNNARGSQAESGFVPWTATQAANFLNPTKTESASFTPTLGTTTFCDTNAAASDITVTLPTPAIANDWFEIHLKTDHATRKLTCNGQTLLISGEYIRVVYDGAAWNNFFHKSICQAHVYRGSAQSIGNNAIVAISFSSELFDVGSIATSGTTPIVLRRDGKIAIFGGWVTPAALDDGERAECFIKINGSSFYGHNLTWSPTTNAFLGVQSSIELDLNSGDTIGLDVRHIEGAPINTQTSSHQRPFLLVYEVD